MEKEILENMDKVVSFIEESSPVVWEAVYKQQLIDACIGIFTFFLSIAITIFAIYVWKNEPEWALNDIGDNIIGFILLIISLISIIATTLILFLMAIPRLLNPTYFAIKALAPEL